MVTTATRSTTAATNGKANGRASSNGEYHHRLIVEAWLQATGIDFTQKDRLDAGSMSVQPGAHRARRLHYAGRQRQDVRALLP
jgi:hypothetical protein